MTGFTRADTSLIGRWWWTIDRWTLLALGMLIGSGMILTLAASPAVALRIGAESFHFVQRQSLFLVPSLFVMFAISLSTPLQVRRVAALAFLGAYLLLVATLFVGAEIKGSTRWIVLGALSIQPSEFIKPTFIVVSAWMLAERARNPAFPGGKLSSLLWAAVALPLVLQPDFGQTLLLTTVWGAQLFLAGLPMLVAAGFVLAGLAGIVGGYFLLPHVASRIDRFLNPESGDTFQIDTALSAFTTGGLWGRGPGEGVIKRILPDAHTDFIFAVAGEEFGTLACVMLVSLFAFVVLRGFARLLQESDPFVLLAGAGLLIQFGLQALINIGVNLHLLPAKGMTLPFISYGGSSLMALALGMGMVLALTRLRPGRPVILGGTVR
jgi:cell division protein FtsW